MAEVKEKQQRGQLNFIQLAPRKVRLVSRTIKGLPVWQAEAQLHSLPHRSSKSLLKLLRSTVANAKNNAGMNAEKLFVKSITVNEAPTLKRFRARAFGRATPILKRTSKITLILGESEKLKSPKYKVVVPDKKEAKKADKKGAEPKGKEQGQEKKEVQDKAAKPSPRAERKSEKAKGDKGGGIFKKMFRRKSI